ncbi:NAD-binding protein [Sphingobacterium sp.]|uniref:NAD-binding protein n=1 Tax=Sphingobacterium sp. TaxID=341027 RepID=UPI0028B1F86C|nr:NAD-binding protein [Sphingobacterium sp.]
MNLTRRQKGLLGIAFVCFLIILSWIGLSKFFPESNSLRYLPDRIYRIIKIVFGGDPSGSGLEAENVPWELILAKICAIGILLFGAYKIIQKVFSEQFNLLKASFKQNHVISVGISKKGRQLFQSLKEDYKQKGIAIEKETDHADINSVKKQGHLVIIGNAEEESTLLEAGIKRASSLIVFLENEQTVIEIIESVQDIYDRSKCQNDLLCFLHISNPRLIDLVKNTGIHLDNNQIQLRFFNIHKMLARQFFSQLPLDLQRDGKKLSDINKIVFLGYGDFAKAMMVQAMRIFHISVENDLKIAVYSEQAEKDRNYFNEQYPKANKIFPIEFHNFQETYNELISREELLEKGDETLFITAFDQDQTNLNSALELLDKAQNSKFPIYVLNAEGKGLRKLIRYSEESDRIKFFGQMEDICNLEFITGNKLDRLAQAIHDDYRKLLSGASSESARYTSDWLTLSEDAKDASRAQADHIPYKFLLTHKEWPVNQPDATSFSEDEVETLAIIEHNRWMAHRYINGWDYGEVRNDELKLHPSLIPWEILSESEKQKDRDTILRIKILLNEK